MLSSWVYVSRSVTTRISTVPAILLLSLNDLVNPITPSESPKPPRWRSPHAYFSTSAQERASGPASMESTHTNDQGADVLESPEPSWVELFCNWGLRGPARKRRLGWALRDDNLAESYIVTSTVLPPI